MFFPDHLNEQYFPLVELDTTDSALQTPLLISSRRLAEIWNLLGHFCNQVNETVADQRKLSDQLLLDTTASVMYGLLDESIQLDQIDAMTRLALLSFCASTLLSWNQLQMPLGWLQQEYQQSLHNFMMSPKRSSGLRGRVDPAMQLWYLLTYATSFYPLSADAKAELSSWLVEVLRSAELTDWTAAKHVLTKFPWIDTVCDARTQKVIEETLAFSSAIPI